MVPTVSVKKNKVRAKRMQLRMDVFDNYGGPKCNCCGEDNIFFLAIDHLHGGGNKHRKVVMSEGYATIYDWLRAKNYPAGFQVLCHNCNHGKYLNFGVCPHHQVIYPTVDDGVDYTKIRQVIRNKVAFRRREAVLIREFVRNVITRPLTIQEILLNGNDRGFKPWNRDRMKKLLPELIEEGVVLMVSPAVGPSGATYISTRRFRPEMWEGDCVDNTLPSDSYPTDASDMEDFNP